VQIEAIQNVGRINQLGPAAVPKSPAPLSPELGCKNPNGSCIPGREQTSARGPRVFVQDDFLFILESIDASGDKPADPSVVFARAVWR